MAVVVRERDGPARSIKLDLGWAARNRKKGSHYGSALIGRRGVNPGALVSGGDGNFWRTSLNLSLITYPMTGTRPTDLINASGTRAASWIAADLIARRDADAVGKFGGYVHGQHLPGGHPNLFLFS